MIPRLFLALTEEAPAVVRLTGEEHHYLTRVLRLRAGDLVHLLWQQPPGRRAVARIIKSDPSGSDLAVESVVTEDLPPRPRVTLLQGMPKGDKLDLIMQKATELGAARIVPVLCSRSVAWPDVARAQQRQKRWQRIALAAAQQSRRTELPEIGSVMLLRDALLEAARSESLRVLLYEGAQGLSLRQLLPEVLPQQLVLLVGPEGGLDPGEVEAATQAGFVACGLGPHILRTETCALCVLSIISYLCDM